MYLILKTAKIRSVNHILHQYRNIATKENLVHENMTVPSTDHSLTYWTKPSTDGKEAFLAATKDHTRTVIEGNTGEVGSTVEVAIRLHTYLAR